MVKCKCTCDFVYTSCYTIIHEYILFYVSSTFHLCIDIHMVEYILYVFTHNALQPYLDKFDVCCEEKART